ncbi:MAG: Smr/MutS family protein [Treponema sp.]|jgi:DNA mismatch repair protein MutS2|nr:Smr/MutS family protein [Treponema sp.]
MMNEDLGRKTRGLLEYPRVMEMVAARSRSDEAADMIRNGEPRAGTAETLKAQVSFAVNLLAEGGGEDGGSLPSIGFLFPRLETQGAALAIDEAYAIGIFVERGGELLRWFFRGGREVPPFFDGLESLPSCAPLADNIFRVVDREGRLRDLPEFRAIKKRIASIASRIEAAVARYTGNEETRRMLQSTVPSQRDGRVVLAVKANFRGRIPGIVHEVSSSGQTVFLEPSEAVEGNNSILIEKRLLDAEILRVLRELTAHIAGGRADLEIFHRGIVELETLRARARYSRETGGNFARCPDAGKGAEPFVLLGARHPLLGSSAVPIDFSMDSGVRTVIITGPNTGGKTAALKTAGLLVLMNQSGLALPAGEAVLPVFDGVYADIGDEQSLSQSLSTFSGHMTTIAGIMGAAAENSLVLLDELGSGTDPEEGSAIAMAVLDHFIEKKTRLIATTHHGILKNYGYSREGVENASVEFDGRTLSPTYRIVMGIPGESRAVDIAARNGLPPSVVEKARGYLAEERSDVSALIRSLEEKHRELDRSVRESRAGELRLREERRRADLRELSLRQKEAELRAGAAGRLRDLLDESRKTLENLVREVKEGELTREKTVRVKEFLRGLERSVGAEDAVLDAEEKILALERRRVENAGNAEGAPCGTLPGHGGVPVFAPGARVLAGPSRRKGIIARRDKKKAGEAGEKSWIVEVGSLKMSFAEDDLVLLVNDAPKTTPGAGWAADMISPSALGELGIRGMRLDEALEALRKQIDAAVLSGLGRFAVIHGKGGGVLMKGVHECLAGDPRVADYYFSRPELGGFGRTEVVLK